MRWLGMVAALAAGAAHAEGWEPIRNVETGRGAVVCTADFAECFGLRCVPARGTEFFLMARAGDLDGPLTLRVDGAPVAERVFVRETEWGDLIAPYGGERDAGLIRALRTGGALRVDLPQAAYEFSLTGSGQAIDDTLAACR